MPTSEKIELTAEEWYMPPELTPLWQTYSHGGLSLRQQRDYNRLHALYFHEQIVFFEQEIICPVLRALAVGLEEEPLRRGVGEFIKEEIEHSAMFHGLLREEAPEWYADSPYHFIRCGFIEKSLLQWGVEHPRWFPMYLWLILLLEERAMFCSRAFVEGRGNLRKPYYEVQRRHLADEVDHVQWDEELIATVWNRTPLSLRKANLRMLDWMLGEFVVAPKRAAIRVVEQLVFLHPELRGRLGIFIRELRELGGSVPFRKSIFGPAAPRARRLMEGHPECDSFRAYWLN